MPSPKPRSRSANAALIAMAGHRRGARRRFQVGGRPRHLAQQHERRAARRQRQAAGHRDGGGAALR
eukprot:358908-Chlamydomonas_euryale.AAC.1